VAAKKRRRREIQAFFSFAIFVPFCGKNLKLKTARAPNQLGELPAKRSWRPNFSARRNFLRPKI
jgi:hypothetical protein